MPAFLKADARARSKGRECREGEMDAFLMPSRAHAPGSVNFWVRKVTVSLFLFLFLSFAKRLGAFVSRYWGVGRIFTAGTMRL